VLGKILGWLATGGIAAVGEQLRAAYEARLKATNDHERLEAEKEIARLEAQQSILLAEQGRWLTAWVRPAIALPFVIYLWKLIIYDKVLAWGATDNLSPELWQMMTVIIGAYFLTRPLEGLFRKR
jgi:uncharacterized membrane protein